MLRLGCTMCMCVVYVCIYICMCVRTYVHVCTYVCMYVCMCVCTHIYNNVRSMNVYSILDNISTMLNQWSGYKLVLLCSVINQLDILCMFYCYIIVVVICICVYILQTNSTSPTDLFEEMAVETGQQNVELARILSGMYLVFTMLIYNQY